MKLKNPTAGQSVQVAYAGQRGRARAGIYLSGRRGREGLLTGLPARPAHGGGGGDGVQRAHPLVPSASLCLPMQKYKMHAMQPTYADWP